MWRLISTKHSEQRSTSHLSESKVRLTLNVTGERKVYCSFHSTLMSVANALARSPLVPIGLTVLIAFLKLPSVA